MHWGMGLMMHEHPRGNWLQFLCIYIYIISRIYDLAASLYSCLYHAAIQAKSQQQQQKQELNMR